MDDAPFYDVELKDLLEVAWIQANREHMRQITYKHGWGYYQFYDGDDQTIWRVHDNEWVPASTLEWCDAVDPREREPLPEQERLLFLARWAREVIAS